jgi:hypothetical protein
VARPAKKKTFELHRGQVIVGAGGSSLDVGLDDGGVLGVDIRHDAGEKDEVQIILRLEDRYGRCSAIRGCRGSRGAI